jgi:RNA polymerase sigma factor (sigma-70 family)
MIAACPSHSDPKRCRSGKNRWGYIDHALFHLPATRRRIAALDPGPAPVEDDGAAVGGSPALARLCRRRPLGKRREQYLFCLMNYERFLAARCEESLTQQPRHGAHRARLRKARDEHRRRAEAVRNEIVEANLRLAVKEAARVADAIDTVEDLVADATAPLIRAVELFDVSRGYSFSTYATHTLRNHFRRRGRCAARQRRILMPGDARLFQETPDDRTDPRDESRRHAERQRITERFLAKLPPRERHVLCARFGLTDGGPTRTYQEIAATVGLSKERVRIIAHQALDRLREEAAAEGWELPV